MKLFFLVLALLGFCFPTNSIPNKISRAEMHQAILGKVTGSVGEVPQTFEDGVFYPDDSPKWMFVCVGGLVIRGSARDGAIVMGGLERGQRVLVHEWHLRWAMIAPARWVNGDGLCLLP